MNALPTLAKNDIFVEYLNIVVLSTEQISNAEHLSSLRLFFLQIYSILMEFCTLTFGARRRSMSTSYIQNTMCAIAEW